MARFYAEIQGMRGEATRLGSEKSGIRGHVRDWNVGAEVRCFVDNDGLDTVRIWKTGGSNGAAQSELIAEFKEDS